MATATITTGPAGIQVFVDHGDREFFGRFGATDVATALAQAQHYLEMPGQCPCKEGDATIDPRDPHAKCCGSSPARTMDIDDAINTLKRLGVMFVAVSPPDEPGAGVEIEAKYVPPVTIPEAIAVLQQAGYLISERDAEGQFEAADDVPNRHPADWMGGAPDVIAETTFEQRLRMFCKRSKNRHLIVSSEEATACEPGMAADLGILSVTVDTALAAHVLGLAATEGPVTAPTAVTLMAEKPKPAPPAKKPVTKPAEKPKADKPKTGGKKTS